MGYQTIQKHRKELQEKTKIYEALIKSAKSLTDQWAKVQEAEQKIMAEGEKIWTVMNKMANEMEKLDTQGIAEFEEFRKGLLAVGKGEVAHTDIPPVRPIEVAVSKMRQSVEQEHRKWIEKLAANMPAELKPGMVLIDKTIGNEYEIKAGPYPAKNVNLHGDDAIIYDIICHREGRTSEFPMKKSELKKKGMKFVRS